MEKGTEVFKTPETLDLDLSCCKFFY